MDMHEKFLTILENAIFMRMPILMDTKAYVEADIGIITGSIRTDHDKTAAMQMRKTCKQIIALGTCAVYGGPQGAAYAHTTKELTDCAFKQNATTKTHLVPSNVPKLLNNSYPIDTFINVDLYMPGCPPHAAFIFDGLASLIRSRQTRIGRSSVCFRCKRVMRKTDVTKLNRIIDYRLDPDLCFLSQGILCFGSVTLDRCLAPCPSIGVPCFSCGGPTEDIILEPQKDVRSQMALRMSHLTDIAYYDIVNAIEKHAKTHFAYAMASPVFRQKPTFLLKKWMSSPKKN
jgi:F420-non-reducing hydrogenase small subunit